MLRVSIIETWKETMHLKLLPDLSGANALLGPDSIWRYRIGMPIVKIKPVQYAIHYQDVILCSLKMLSYQNKNFHFQDKTLSFCGEAPVISLIQCITFLQSYTPYPSSILTEAWSKWPPFCGHFLVHFSERIFVDFLLKFNQNLFFQFQST